MAKAEDMRVLTPEEVSDLLKIKTRQVIELARRGRIPAKKVGKFWRFPADPLKRWIQSGLGEDNSPDIDLEVDRLIRGGV